VHFPVVRVGRIVFRMIFHFKIIYAGQKYGIKLNTKCSGVKFNLNNDMDAACNLSFDNYLSKA